MAGQYRSIKLCISSIAPQIPDSLILIVINARCSFPDHLRFNFMESGGKEEGQQPAGNH